MITAIVEAEIRPGMHERLREVADKLENEFAPHEEGCEMYRSYIDGDNFVTLERWSDQEALDEHLRAAHVEQLVPELRKCVVDGVFEVTFIDSEELRRVRL